jgi:hypothetical protein
MVWWQQTFLVMCKGPAPKFPISRCKVGSHELRADITQTPIREKCRRELNISPKRGESSKRVMKEVRG